MRKPIYLLAFFLIFSCSNNPLIEEEEETPEVSIQSELIGSGTLYPLAENPRFTTVENTDLENNSLVGIIVLGSEIRVYPYWYTYEHEIINDTYNETKFAFTYCPLTKSSVAFTKEDNFRASGFLLNDNLVPWDKKTESLWSQMLGKGIRGEREDENLKTFPIIETKWETVKTYFPNAKVLTDDYVARSANSSQNNSKIVPQKGEHVFGIINRSFSKDTKVAIFKYSDFINTKRMDVSFGSKRYIVIGDDSKRIINAFVVADFDDYITLENQFPYVLQHKDGIKYTILGLGTDDTQLKGIDFGYVALWGAWKEFYSEFIFQD